MYICWSSEIRDSEPCNQIDIITRITKLLELLKGMEIIIGREAGVAEPRLCLKIGNTSKYLGNPGSVPKSVSRSHCVLSVDGKNSLKINNVSGGNVVYVNGIEYMSKDITVMDLVQLGPEKYVLDVASVIKVVSSAPAQPAGPTNQQSYDITSLKRIWDDYTQAKLDMQIRERKLGALSAIPGVMSMISILLALIKGLEGLRGLFITIAAVFACSFAIMRVRNASKVPLIQKEMDEKFQDEYICPHCSHFLGNQRYELILRNGSCPWCKSKYTER